MVLWNIIKKAIDFLQTNEKIVKFVNECIEPYWGIVIDEVVNVE